MIIVIIIEYNIPQKPWFPRDKYLETWLIDFTIQWIIITGWWLGHPSEKYESQLG